MESFKQIQWNLSYKTSPKSKKNVLIREGSYKGGMTTRPIPQTPIKLNAMLYFHFMIDILDTVIMK